MRVVCTSDLHGHLPEIPECDLLLIGGDIVPVVRTSMQQERAWLLNEFSNWLRSVPVQRIVGIAGNHDFPFQNDPSLGHELPWDYLCESAIEIDGVVVYGCPWTPWFFDWAFNAPRNDHEETFLAEKWNLAPPGADIILSHGPPRECGDRVIRSNEPVGSRSLRSWIERHQPTLVVCGHIHEGFGAYRIGETRVLNVSHMDFHYRPVNAPIMLDNFTPASRAGTPTARRTHPPPSGCRLGSRR